MASPLCAQYSSPVSSPANVHKGADELIRQENTGRFLDKIDESPFSSSVLKKRKISHSPHSPEPRAETPIPESELDFFHACSTDDALYELCDLKPVNAKPLGDGGSADVKKYQKIIDGQPQFYAVKLLSDKANKNFLSYHKGEITALHLLDHPNIVKCHGLLLQHETEKHYCFITRSDDYPWLDCKQYKIKACMLDFINGIESYYAIYGDDQDINPLSNIPSETVLAVQWGLQVCKAVKHIHDHNCIHRDIKSENILYDLDSQSIKLVDFGFSKKMFGSKKTSGFCGTRASMAPEMFKKQGNYDKSIDIWSIGIFMMEIAFDYSPYDYDLKGFYDDCTETCKFKERIEKFSKLNNSQKISRFNHQGDEDSNQVELLMHLIANMTKEKPEDRISIEDAIETLTHLQKNQVITQ